MTWHSEHTDNFTFLEKIESKIADFCGTRTFFIIHVCWFTFWILKPVENFPYGLLTMIVSLEAILLSTIIMMNQRRHDSIAQKNAENDMRVEREKLDKIISLLEYRGKVSI